ncbi:MAG: MMPL family transporter [Lachnospiraceae bacterium]|nr:MMPL family transporter [Lachnospiraceae bacterium]
MKEKKEKISLKENGRKIKEKLTHISFKNFSIVDMIIDKRKTIEVVFAVLFVICLLLSPMVKVNYDLTEYLPESVTSKKAIDLMEQEFGYPGTARIMIKDVSIYEASIYKQMIEKIDGVDMVSWMSSDVYMSQGFVEVDKQKDYYKDDCAVMDVTFVEGDTTERTKEAVGEIQELLGEKGCFAGPAVENKSLEKTLNREIDIATTVAVIMILLILILTTTSWFEPVLFLSIMGIAIILNRGTNIFMGTISFLSSSVSSILQLAISMDYSIFLLHTFVREKNTGIGKEQAMSNALRLSALSILSSAATTFVGFMALFAMKFSLGADIGIVLGKSIIWSVGTVIFLMPALILKFDDLIERTQHKNLMPTFEKFSHGVYKIRYGVLAFIIIVVLPAYIAQDMNSFTFGNSSLGASEGTVVYNDTQEIEQKFGRSNLYLAILPNESRIKEKELADKLEDLSYVKSVTALAKQLPEGIPESIVPESITGLLRTENYTRMLIFTRTKSESDFAFETSDEIQKMVKEYYPENSYVVGNTPSTQDLKEICLSDYMVVNILSLIGVALVVAIAFRSLLIPIIVLIPINVAIFINMAIPYLEGETFLFAGYVIVCCIQLGATVDYSILLTNNYLDARVEMDKKEAAIHAVQKSALSIFTSGSILTVAGYGIFFISSVAAVSSIGHMVGRGALLSLILVVLVLPALLTMFDKNIFREKHRIERINKDAKRRRRKVRARIMEKTVRWTNADEDGNDDEK